MKQTKALDKAHSEKKDFDVCCKIVQLFEKDEYTNELKLRDGSNQTFYCQTLKLKFPHIRKGDVVRIRSCTFDDTASSKKVLNLSHYSNMMTFISGAKIAKDLKAKASDDKVDKAAMKAAVNMNPVYLTEVDKKYQDMAFTSLHELFHNAASDQEIANKTTFRTSFNVVRFEPSDVKEFTKVFDKKTKKTTSLKGSSATKAAGNLIYQV